LNYLTGSTRRHERRLINESNARGTRGKNWRHISAPKIYMAPISGTGFSFHHASGKNLVTKIIAESDVGDK